MKVCAAVMEVVSLVAWLAGLVLAKGFWSTTFAVVMPPWAWYLVAERLMAHFGIT